MILEGWLQMLSDDKCTHLKQKDHWSPGAYCPACQRVRALVYREEKLCPPRPLSWGEDAAIKARPRGGLVFQLSSLILVHNTYEWARDSCCCLWLSNWALRPQHLPRQHLQLPGLWVEGSHPAPACVQTSPAAAPCCWARVCSAVPVHGKPCVHVPDDVRDCEPLREQKTLFIVCRGRAWVGIQFSAEIFSCSRWDTRLCGLWALLLSFPCATSLRYSCRPLLLREKVSLLWAAACRNPEGHLPHTEAVRALLWPWHSFLHCKTWKWERYLGKRGSFQQDWCPKQLCRLCPSGRKQLFLRVLSWATKCISHFGSCRLKGWRGEHPALSVGSKNPGAGTKKKTERTALAAWLSPGREDCVWLGGKENTEYDRGLKNKEKGVQ